VRVLLKQNYDLTQLLGIGGDLAAKIVEIVSTGSCSLLQRLPKLVQLADLKGDLHSHTKATDCHDSLRDMAQAAQAMGFEYLAITEHSRRLTVAHSLDSERLLRQCEEIDHLNSELNTKAGGITILKGIEVDILEDGSLDLPDEVMARLDLVVGAVHSKFDLSRAKQTERILRAMECPHFTLLADSTGRLLEQRAPYDVDMLRIIRQAKNRGCFLELNAHPERLDLLDTYCQLAKAKGVLISINSDAHSRYEFFNLRFGVGQARRGWLEGRDVLNTRPLAELRALIKNTKKSKLSINKSRNGKAATASGCKNVGASPYVFARIYTYPLV
jgi:DNA polymerase (family X)